MKKVAVAPENSPTALADPLMNDLDAASTTEHTDNRVMDISSLFTADHETGHTHHVLPPDSPHGLVELQGLGNDCRRLSAVAVPWKEIIRSWVTAFYLHNDVL